MERHVTPEQAMREKLWASILDTALDAIITINEVSEIIEFNASAERIFGYSRTAVLGRSIADVIIPPHLRQRHREGMQRYLTTGAAQLVGRRIEIEAMHADGHVFPVELAIQPVSLDGQRLFTAYLRDISARQEMEGALRHSEQRFRSLAEANPVPMGIVRLEDSRWLYVSPSLARLVGTTVDELLGSHVEDLHADPEAQQTLHHELLTNGRVEAYEFVLRKKDHTTVPVALNATCIVYEGVDAILGGIMDLSALKQAEAEIARQREALHQSDKLSALGSLLAGVAHELNNPLAVVVGRAIMLEETCSDTETMTAVVKIRQAAERCTRIIKTFLAMARQQQPARTPTNVNHLITEALELVGYGLRTAGVEVSLALASDVPHILADSTQLHQVLTNLLINAQQALLNIPEPRQLRIASRWEPSTNRLQVVVTDNGPGVPVAIRSRIFDPFFTTKPMGVGTGVGLSLSHGVITAHGGTLTLENPTAGGARFVVTLPCEASSVTPALTPSDAPSTVFSPLTILIVDDEPEVSEMLHEMIVRAGHHTVIARSGQAALQHLAAQRVDLILSDLHMPDLNGIDLYHQIQTDFPWLSQRLIFITGDSLSAMASDFLTSTNVPCLYKPVTPNEVLRLISQTAV